MTVAQPTTITDRLCSVAARAVNEDPIGSGGTLTRVLAVEIPVPWGGRLDNADPAGDWLGQSNAIRNAYLARLRAEHGRLPESGYANMYGIAPDDEWTVPGHRRVFVALAPQGELASGYDLTEYLLPTDDDVVSLVRAFFEAPTDLETFERFRSAMPSHRELFVCTHGQVDICCARFGVHLYQQARAAYPAVRAWRITHLGGHRYAPTAWEFPSGYKWAYLDADEGNALVHHLDSPHALRGNMRGWSAVSAPAQLVDREGFVLHGWDWLAYRRRTQILETDEAARRWRVQLDFEGPAGISGTYLATVAIARDITLLGCAVESDDEIGTVPEYVLERFRLVTD
ncbi:MAG: hypothetical protein DWI48_04380 [Chloroflexi bacterium]|nr:MAG: hypothetical protein DWI48_04380 [Chloroflexota bacterium]